MSITAERPVDLTVRQWRKQVVTFARHRGWLTHFELPNIVVATGVPALTLVRSLPGDHRIVFAQLSSQRQQLSSLQRDWLHGLNEVAALCPNVDVQHWRPQDWALVRKTLT